MPKRRVLDYSLDPDQPGDQFLFNLLIAPVAIVVNFVASIPVAVRRLRAPAGSTAACRRRCSSRSAASSRRSPTASTGSAHRAFQLGKFLGSSSCSPGSSSRPRSSARSGSRSPAIAASGRRPAANARRTDDRERRTLTESTAAGYAARRIPTASPAGALVVCRGVPVRDARAAVQARLANAGLATLGFVSWRALLGALVVARPSSRLRRRAGPAGRRLGRPVASDAGVARSRSSPGRDRPEPRDLRRPSAVTDRPRAARASTPTRRW